ncbi:unnamed protein product [Penicillium nalgiovense]|uniref:NACHT domain-containing protein n=1 Tax=Penicillium nalgiovense TaxID=60175 RepID=A0A9W4MUI8_PENNA|nr:unnamed protein product [Penicillium nalgiovense]CAG7995058.1 unnamed protein product [Penicillium nalgiovense]CAG8116250.1 unnamed protein product [Penicillium nalgiovense]CAG8144889.1 unnamed protein product [Penicillium nalgiovense]CAG8152884.1 unnamed protein product [Penicillium nalgiovense]
MGKTVLMSNVVHHLQLNAARKSNEIVSYYFCRVDNEASSSARNILGSLARQILDTQIEQSEYETLLSLQEITEDLSSTTEVVQFLLSHLEAIEGTKYYVILDGLDECDENQVQEVAQAMTELCSNYVGFKVLCAGRPGLEKRFKLTAPQYRIIVNAEKVKSDMDRYITKTLDKRCLTLGDQAIVTEIHDTLRAKADGMFLWASLCIEEICAQTCDHDILEALKHLPRSLAELYDRKLRHVPEGRAGVQARKMLQYCGVVKRPLTVTEYREALSLSLEQKSFDHRKAPNDMDRIINGSCGLTFVDEEEDTIHYVHRSVKECLFVTNGPRIAQFDMASEDRDFGFLCMTYLDFSNFKHQLTNVRNGSGIPINPLQFGTSTLPTHTSRTVTGQMARRILSHHRPLQHFSTREVERTAQEILEGGSSSRLELELRKQGFQFLEYARAYWLNHLADLTPNMDSNMWLLFCRCIEGDDVPACRPWELEQQTHNKRNDVPGAIQWSLAHGHSALLLYYAMYQSHILSEDVKVEIFRSANIHSRYRYTEVLVRLENTRNVLNHGLSYAALDGCIRSLALLLQAGAGIDAQVNHRTALQVAIEAGHLEVVQALLAAKADVQVSPEFGGRAALQAAAEAGHLEMVQALLEAKANANTYPEYGDWKALESAAESGHFEVVQALLVARANVNVSSAECEGRTALQAAAGRGHLLVVQALVAANADVNASPIEWGRRALQAAAGGGHLDVVQELLAINADVNASPTEVEAERLFKQPQRGATLRW